MTTRIRSKPADTITSDQVMAELERKGREQSRKTYARHGIDIPMFGVSIADLKIIAKKIRGNQQLALELDVFLRLLGQSSGGLRRGERLAEVEEELGERYLREEGVAGLAVDLDRRAGARRRRGRTPTGRAGAVAGSALRRHRPAVRRAYRWLRRRSPY